MNCFMTKPVLLTIGGSVPCAVKFGNDQQGFVGNAREDGSGRIRRHSKIEATASDGAENAGDHFVTSFLVFGHRKGGASKRSSAQEDKGKVESGYLGNYIYALQILSEYVWIVFP